MNLILKHDFPFDQFTSSAGALQVGVILSELDNIPNPTIENHLGYSFEIYCIGAGSPTGTLVQNFFPLWAFISTN